MLFGICAVLMLTGCGQSQGEEITSSPSKDTSGIEAAPSKSDSASVKDENEIILDLSENQDFYTLFDSNCYDENGNYSGSFYTIDELAITRRRIDEESGTDDVYVAVVSSSQTSKYTGEFHLLYSLYDVGGWYLENIELKSGTLVSLFEIPKEEIYTFALNILCTCGADASSIYLDSQERISSEEEVVVVGVDFNDGIIAVQGGIELHCYFDGVKWTYEHTDTNLYYDIVADGSYTTKDYNYPTILVFNHENGLPVVRYAGTREPPKVHDWNFDCLRRAYFYYVEGANGKFLCEYRFGSDGSICKVVDGREFETYYRFAEPITDADTLWDTLRAFRAGGYSW